MQDKIRGAFDKITLPADADERIRRTLAEAASQPKKEVIQMQKNHRRKAPKLAVALIAAVCVLTVSALALAISRVELVSTDMGDYIEVDFQATDEDYVELGNWYPGEIPEGYALSFVSDPAYGYQTIRFENGDGHYITLSVQGDIEGGQVTMDNVTDTQSVTVGEAEGVLYTTATERLLFWTDGARGLGFSLTTDDDAVDLTAMAESVEELDEALTPTLSGGYSHALADLGDYQITPPEGYEQASFTASPLSSGGGWYAYVRYTYENSGHDELHFSYESYNLTEDAGTGVEFGNTPEYVLSLQTGGRGYTATTVNGELAAYYALGDNYYGLSWVDTENCLVFQLTSDTLTMEALVEVAESMTLNG
ncbi:MAG: DUF4367 domain-containing protein [Oscillospiraceae bacterium]|nr:DUF4367 domain-containing protein [Oscillospiraceae bacterium]